MWTAWPQTAGTLIFPLLIQALKETGFQDYLVFEFRANPPADAAKAGLDYIRALL